MSPIKQEEMMKIGVRYPEIMAWQHSTSIEVADNANLNTIQSEIFQKFQSDFESFMPEGHRSFCERFRNNGFVLKDRNFTISDDAELRERMSQEGSSLQAIFKTVGESIAS